MWKTAQRSKGKHFGQIFVKNVVLMGKNMKAGLCKLKFCTEANQTLPFKSLQNNFLHSRPLHGAKISQIFSFTRTASSHNIQLVPNIQNTSFHIPVKSSIDSRAVVATIQLVPNYKSKVKVISKYFDQKQLFPWEMAAEGQMQLFNGDKTIEHWSKNIFSDTIPLNGSSNIVSV